MFCLGTDKIQLGYTILEDGTVLTASQVDEMFPPVSEGSRSGHSSGASSPGVDDPDRYVIQENSLLSCGYDDSRTNSDPRMSFSPAPRSGDTSPGRKREFGITAKKGAIHVERRFNA